MVYCYLDLVDFDCKCVYIYTPGSSVVTFSGVLFVTFSRVKSK